MFPIQAHRSLRLILFSSVLAIATGAHAGDLRIKIPKRSKPTPVQKLNQDGVKAVQKHDYEKAKRLFYKAYLVDPNDPFTLNNLGYIAELEGEIERAQRYYALAAEQPSAAEVAVASSNDLKGKQVDQVAGNAADRQMQVNRTNVYAMGLLLKDRAPEADVALNKALALDAKNPFTLNNLGWAKEKEGELELAYRYYSQAHDLNSNEPVVVTMNKGWRGKSISEVAGENAKNVRKMMGSEESNEAKLARLNLRGVSAVNRNDRRLARQYFEQAYKLDPNNAFTLNNMGYIAELDGDRETANFFYDKATEAQRSDSRVAVATRRDLEGMRMSNVATANGQAVDQAVQTSLEERRREGGPVVLKRRDNTPIVDPDRPPPKPQQSEPQGQVQQERIPVYSQPDANAPIQEVMPPLENQPNGTQPANPSAPGGALPQGSEPQQQQPTPAQPQGQPTQTQPAPGQNPPGSNAPTGGVIEPLPDNQQPPNAGQTSPQQTSPQTQPPQQQNQSQPPQTQTVPPESQQQTPDANSPVQGVIAPLPDNQQPPNAGQQPPPQNPK